MGDRVQQIMTKLDFAMTHTHNWADTATRLCVATQKRQRYDICSWWTCVSCDKFQCCTFILKKIITNWTWSQAENREKCDYLSNTLLCSLPNMFGHSKHQWRPFRLSPLSRPSSLQPSPPAPSPLLSPSSSPRQPLNIRSQNRAFSRIWNKSYKRVVIWVDYGMKRRTD